MDPSFSNIVGNRLIGCLVAISLLLAACLADRGEESGPILLIGIDGGEWQVIERLWGEGRLPNLRGLAERGASTDLATISEMSPVIWTTVATGVEPAQHGIVDFVIATEQGDRPVSSSLRRVPAFWNILSDQGIGVSVFGWWATWPAESIAGVMLSDRAFESLDQSASPESYQESFLRDRQLAVEDSSLSLPRKGIFLRDRLVAWAARQRLRQAPGDDQMVAVYLRSVDVMSHLHWRELAIRTEAEELDPVTKAYQHIDQAIGELVAAAGEGATVMVVSDHGFRGLEHERVTVTFDFDRLLEALGLLVRDSAGAVDRMRSAAYSLQARHNSPRRALRLRQPLESSRAELEAALARVRWSSGGVAFRLLEPRPRERRAGADAIVRVVPHDARPPYLVDGQALADPLPRVQILSGGHGRATSGILLAAGPDIVERTRASSESFSVRDITPTLLYALGLAQAKDFSGRPLVELFSDEARSLDRPAPIASWGTRETGIPAAAAGDEDRLEELRALGYIE